MKPALKELVERRRAAIQTFLDEHSDLFSVAPAELESINEDCPDDDKTSEGPYYLDGWVLILAQRSMSEPEEELIEPLRSHGMPYTKLLGLLERSK